MGKGNTSYESEDEIMGGEFIFHIVWENRNVRCNGCNSGMAAGASQFSLLGEAHGL